MVSGFFLAGATDAFFFFGGGAVFLNGAGVVKGFEAFLPGIHNGVVDVNSADVAVEVVHQLNRNAGVYPFVYAGHNVNYGLLVDVFVFLIKPEFVADKRRAVGNGAFAVSLDKEFAVNGQNRGRAALN